MRIAYLINRYPTVSHSFIRREIRAMEEQGAEVLRFSVRGEDEPLADPADLEERGRTRYLLSGGPGPALAAAAGMAVRRPRAFARACRAALAMAKGGQRSWPYHLIYLAQACLLLRWLEEAPAQHLHAHFGTNPAEIARLARLLGGPPYSFTLHGQDEIEQARGLAFGPKMADAAFAAAVSRHGRAQFLREIDPADWDRVHVVHCGLDRAFLDANPPPLPKAPELLSIARLSEEKGHLILLPAFARLRERHPGARLTLAGDGPMRPAIEAKIAELGLQRAVTITGWISSAEVRARIAAARIVVQPSFIEGLPVVLMEAMAMARPVISTFVGGIPELVTPDAGWLVPAGDADALTDALDTALATSDDKLAGMGRTGRARVLLEHDAEREAERLSALIRGENAAQRNRSETVMPQRSKIA